MEKLLLSTIDNPFNPFTEYEQWNEFDQSHGYNTNSYLARIVKTSHEISEYEQTIAINKAVEEIFRLNILGLYKIVSDSSE